MSDNVIPAEFQIKETQVTEFEEPNPNTFYPNNHGEQGWSPLPPKLERQVGADPVMKYGQDSSAAASQSYADAVRTLVRQHGINQINTTQVTEREGGSYVHYHEPTRDDQVSSVLGQQITGDPETVGQALLVGNKGVERASTIDAYQAKTLLDRQTRGMNDGTQASFLQMLRHKGPEALESVSAGLNEAVGTAFIKATDSGIPLYPEIQAMTPAMRELSAIMKYQGERQRKSAARPQAKYHPAQSNYRSVNGTFAGLDFSASAGAALSSAAPSMPSTDSIPTPTSTSESSYGSRVSSTLLSKMTSSVTNAIPQAPQEPAPSSAPVSSLYSKAVPTTTLSPYNFSRVSTFAAKLQEGEEPDKASTSLYSSGYTPRTPGSIQPSSTPGQTQAEPDYVPGDVYPDYMEADYEIPEPAGMSRNMKIGLAVAAGVGLILLLRG